VFSDALPARNDAKNRVAAAETLSSGCCLLDIEKLVKRG